MKAEEVILRATGNQHGIIWPHPTACYTAADV